MADSKLTELTELISIAADDLLYIVDDSEAPKTSKKIKILNLLNKTFLELENVDNTSDADKPVSTAVQSSLDATNTNVGNNTTSISDNASDLSNHVSDTSNPHNVTKSQVGLGNADNTSDADKPVSTLQQAAINNAINNLIDGAPATLDTLNELAAAIADDENFSTTITTLISNHISDTTNPHSVTKSQVGLGNADNTSDSDKPVSTAQQTALDLKYDVSNPEGYESSAELNARDTANRFRDNHTGTQLASTISNFATTVKNVVLSGLNVVNSVVTNSDTVQEAIGKLQGQINQKGFLQYQNNATVSSTGSWVTIPMPTNRESLPNGLFTKTNNNNFRADFDGYSEINFSIIVDSADNDRSFNVRILKNGVEIPQGLFENIACGKAQNQRRGGMASSFIASCSDGDLFSIQLQEADSSTVQVFSGGCLMTVRAYKVNP